MSTRFLSSLLVLLAAAAACASDNDDSAHTGSPTSVTTTRPPPASVAPTTRRLPAPQSAVPAPPAASTAPQTTARPAAAAQTEMIAIEVAGSMRRYVLHIPPGLDGTPVPLVVDFHGLNASPARQDRVSEMRAKADAEGFVVAQPEAGLVANAWLTIEASPDIAFARAIVEDVGGRVSLDPDRIYASGFSNGGGMVNRLACDAADVFAAVATVAGAYLSWARCEPARAVPVISFHGEADIVVPYDGLGLIPDIALWAESWAERNGCRRSPTEVSVVADVTLSVWTECDDGAGVRLYTIAEGGHGWPGTPDPNRFGDTTAAISATDLIWDFFLAHPMP